MNLQTIKERYLTLFPDNEGVGIRRVEEAERCLSARFPEDFRRIAEFWNGGGIGYVDLLDLDRSNSVNLIDRTAELRSAIGVPHRFVVLAEPDEGLVVLDTEAGSGEASVLWIDAVEAENLATGVFEHEPDSWLSFTDFFARLLDDEAEEREEEER